MLGSTSVKCSLILLSFLTQYLLSSTCSNYGSILVGNILSKLGAVISVWDDSNHSVWCCHHTRNQTRQSSNQNRNTQTFRLEEKKVRMGFERSSSFLFIIFVDSHPLLWVINAVWCMVNGGLGVDKNWFLKRSWSIVVGFYFIILQTIPSPVNHCVNIIITRDNRTLIDCSQ